ncbi:MAG: hypothetical protein ACK42D_00205 [Candidatus Paceibacteria bacterium]
MTKYLQNFVTSLQQNLYYSLLLAFLAIASIIMLGYEFTQIANAQLVTFFTRIDIVIALIFLTDFVAGLLFNTTMSARAFFKQNWLNLASSIPITSDVTRALRILRIVRAFRVIRAGLNFWSVKNRLHDRRNNT